MTVSSNKYVISLGGSLFFTNEGLDISFLKAFRDIVLARVRAGEKFVIAVGGGKTSREYQKALEQVGASTDSRDWVGIYSTRLNANFIKLLFADENAPEIITDPEGEIPDTELVFAGGSKPGWSTDYVSVLIAKNVGAKRVINLTNISHVFDKDPNKFPDAQAIDDLTWEEYKKLIPAEWTPGLHAPFDPRGAREAQAHDIEVVVVGKDIDNLEKVLRGEEFVGTRLYV